MKISYKYGELICHINRLMMGPRIRPNIKIIGDKKLNNCARLSSLICFVTVLFFSLFFLYHNLERQHYELNRELSLITN